MKKTMFLIILIIICLFSGCSNNSTVKNAMDIDPTSENSYNDGYYDGYEDYLNHSKEEIFEDEYNEFKSMIVNLMYDYKYDVVKEIQHYYPEVVEEALENEFGAKNIADVIKYLENYRKDQEKTVVGTCKFCQQTVYANDAIRYSSCNTLHETFDDCSICTYVHSNCLFENDPPNIKKDS